MHMEFKMYKALHCIFFLGGQFIMAESGWV